MRAKVREKALVWLILLLIEGLHGFLFGAKKLYQGTIKPLDPDVCTTQDITFICMLLDPPKLNYSIGFAVKNESTDREYVAVNSNHVTVINETVAEYKINNINVSSMYLIYVRCYYWLKFGDLDSSLQLGETSTASVFQMPQKIEEISCIVENYIQTMNCSWDYGVKYNDNNRPEVTFEWRIPDLSRTWTNCRDLNTEYGYCYWNSSRMGDFTMKIIEVQITLKQDCDVQITSNFTINTRKIVKPDPVINLKSTVLNSTCIEVSWQTNNSEMQYPKEHKLIVSSEWLDNKIIKFNTTSETEKLTHKQTICGLYPYTDYTFTVSIQPTGDQAGFYSDTRTTVVRTYSDIPSSSPEVTDGGYSWYHRDCEGHSNLRRRVCVFWKPIKKDERNGPMKGLKVVFTAVNTEAVMPIEEDLAEDLTYGCSSGLLCNTSYNFTIRARNENGTSKNASSLMISSATSGILPPDFIVESSNEDVYISWTYPETAETDKFVVVRCRNKNGDCENSHEVYWKEFLPDSREAVLKINSSNSAQDYLYGVSAIKTHGSSGLEWQDCVYLKHGVPKRQPQNVVVSTGSKDNTLVVTWDKLTCKSDEPYIAMYNVQCNKLNDAYKRSRNVTASNGARVVFTSLEEGQTYVITVSGITKEGLFGNKSEPVTGVPENKSLKQGVIVGIVMGVLIVLIFAAVGCICIFRKCKKKAKAKLKAATDIKIPEGEICFNNNLTTEITSDGVSTKSVERQNSDDSGFDPMTPQSDKFDKPEFSRTPDDYVVVTTNRDTNTQPTGTTSSIHSSVFHTENTFNPEQRCITIGMVHSENRNLSSETFVKRAGNDETSLKKRAKNVSGDSGMSDAYSKAALGTGEGNQNVKYMADDDDDDENNSAAESDFSGDKTSEFQEKGSDTSFISHKQISKNHLHVIIPKPLAFSEQSCDDKVLSSMVNNSDLDSNSSPDYSQAQMTTLSSPKTRTENFQNRKSDFKSEPQTQISAILPSLTQIPRPTNDEIDIFSGEEEENDFQHPQIEGNQSASLAAYSDAVGASTAIRNNHYVDVGRNMHPVAQRSTNALCANYVTTDNTSCKSDRLDTSPYTQQTSSDKGYSSAASTSKPEANVEAVQLSFNQSDSQSKSQNIHATIDYVSSEPALPVISTQHLPHSSASYTLSSSNAIQECSALSSNPNLPSVEGYLPQKGCIYNPTEGYSLVTSPSSNSSSYINPADACTPALQSLNLSPVTPGKVSSSYVTSPELQTIPSSYRDINMQQDSVLSSGNETESHSGGYIGQTDLIDDIAGQQFHQGYVDVLQLAKDEVTEIEEGGKNFESSVQSNGTENEKMAETNGYVAHQVLSQGCTTDHYLSINGQPPNLTTKMIREANEGEEEESRQRTDSDSGLSSLEHGSPELGNRQFDRNDN